VRIAIAHYVPFAPGRCGLYETTRDILVAERLLGHEAILIDAGVPGEDSRAGEVDARGDHAIEAHSHVAAADCDILVTHTDVPDRWARRLGVPVVHIVHGRPVVSFTTSCDKQNNVYGLYRRWGQDPLRRRIVTLWREHLPYLEALIPADKLATTSAPPLDRSRYPREGEVHDFGSRKGALNILIADVHRPDNSPYHLVHGLALAAPLLPGLRVHLYALPCDPSSPWQYLLRHLRSLGILGEAKGMMRGIDRVYRAADLVLTTAQIGTRIVREAWSCGTPVVAAAPNRHARITYTPGDPESIADAVRRGAQYVAYCEGRPDECERYAEPFGLERVGPELIEIYEAALEPASVA